MAAVHQHFRLDDRHDAVLLAQRGIAGERVARWRGCRCRSACRRRCRSRRATWRSGRRACDIRRAARARPSRPSVMTSPGQNGSGLAPLSTLMPGIEPACLDDLDQRRAVLGLLPDGLVIEDDAGDVFRHRLGRAEHHLAIVAAVVLGGLHADGVEALLDGARGSRRRPGCPCRERPWPRRSCSILRDSSDSSPYVAHWSRWQSAGSTSAATDDSGRLILPSTPRPRARALPSIHSRKAPPAVET